MGTTDRDYADKEWLERDERLPIPSSLLDVLCAVLAALGLAAVIFVALGLR